MTKGYVQRSICSESRWDRLKQSRSLFRPPDYRLHEALNLVASFNTAFLERP
jgi:hypothetical protein